MRTARCLFAATVMCLALSAVFSAQQSKDNGAEVALQAAIKIETIDGDLRAAIEAYKKVVATHETNRAVAARALVRMGQCYDKLGASDSKAAQKAYERVLSQFADQAAPVAEARTRLAVMRAEPAGGGVNDQLLFTSRNIESVSDVSADGRYLVLYEKSWVLRDWRSGESLKIGTFGEYYPPHLSPDGRRVAYATAGEGNRWQLKVASIDGSSVRVLAEGQGPIAMEPTDWSPDGTRLLVPECQEGKRLPCDLSVMSVADGSIRRLGVQASGWQDNGGSKWSPDGGYILYVNQGLFVISVDGTANVRVAAPQPGRAFSPLWAPDGRHVLYVSNRAGVSDLLAVEVKAGKPVGAAVVIKAEVGNMTPIGATRDGTVFWKKVFNRGDVFVADLDPVSGRPMAPAAGLHERGGALGSAPLAWSPDGGSLAFVRRVPGASGRIFIRSIQTGEERVVPGDYPGPRDLHWLPDGSLLAMVVIDGQPGFGVETVDPSTGQHKTVLSSIAGIRWPEVTVSPDGRAFYYQVMDAVNSQSSMDLRLMRHDMGVAEDKVIYRAKSSGIGFFSLSASPDGRQLAFALFPEGGGDKCPLMTLALEGALTRTLTGSLGYGNIAGTAWAPDSQSLFAVTTPDGSSPSDILRFPAGGGTPGAIPGAVAATLREIHNLSTTRDGRRLAFATGDFVLEAWMTRNALPKAGAAPDAKSK